ncbi:MAG TPA: HAMP domain-containing sensor histidine kinase [Candidatus Limnocylindrales bacterium]|nr:HAMP domain-containing sensor histidine kinase [Candidatus Limnocylindrales bacterium]
MPDLPAEAAPELAPPESPSPDSIDAGSVEEDARLVRRVRWRLVLFSGGSTLLLLVVLAGVLYASVENSLSSASIAQLQQRADSTARVVESGRQGPGPGPDNLPTGIAFGGGTAGTFVMLVSGDGKLLAGPREFAAPEGLPITTALSTTPGASPDIRDVTASFTSPGATTAVDVPVRVYTEATTVSSDVATVLGVSATAPVYIEVVQDRSTEAQTLQSLLVVLLLGGFVMVIVAAGFGWLYARRALVPIRDSLTAQRTALRRQREFAADASHELRTPLTVIRSSVEHLRRHAAEPVSSVGEALEDIDAEVSHLTSMVDDLLLLARSDSGAVTLDRVPLQLDDVAGEAAAALAGPAQARGVRLVVDPEPVAVVGDPARLRQLVTILLDNAIRHSPSGGEVRVSVRTFEDEASLTVADQGPGIRPADLPHIFDRFWRAPGAPAGGTGLGLAIARWIAERHGGSVEAASPEAGGALFTVRLPATAAPAT